MESWQLILFVLNCFCIGLAFALIPVIKDEPGLLMLWIGIAFINALAVALRLSSVLT